MVTIGNHRFTKKECGIAKTSATSAAKDIRAKGRMARVVPNTDGKGFCVLEGPVSTTIQKRNKAAVSGAKKSKPKAHAKKK
jgi:hypothetical protein